MVTTLRVAFFGTPDFAVPTLQKLIASRHDVVAVVSQPDRPRGRGHKLQPTPTKVAAESAGVPVLQPERIREASFLQAVSDMRLDLGVVAAYGKILPEALLRLPRLGMINVHASLLPQYRGAAPIHRAVIDGQSITGVTIMRVVRELDAGAMIDIVRHPIGPDDTSPEVERALADLGGDLLVSVVDRMAEGPVAETPQDDSQATYAAKITRGEGLVDWTLPSGRLHDLVRGLQPWPLVAAVIDGSRYLVHRTSRSGERTDAEPGTIAQAGGGRLSVACGDGEMLDILEIQPEGKRVMTVRELLAGRSIRAGTRLETPAATPTPGSRE